MSFKETLKANSEQSISKALDKLLRDTAEKGLYCAVLSQTNQYDLLTALNLSPDRDDIIANYKDEGLMVNITEFGGKITQILFDWSK